VQEKARLKIFFFFCFVSFSFFLVSSLDSSNLRSDPIRSPSQGRCSSLAPPPGPGSTNSIDAMEKGPTPKSTNLFQVYLRLRPPHSGASTTGERFLAVEEPDDGSSTPKHITLNPPNDRRRAVEKFAFTQVFEEDATQLDVFHCTGVADLIKGVLAPCGGDGTDALLATLGVTGSGKVSEECFAPGIFGVLALLTCSIIDAYHFGVTVSTGPHPALVGCHLPISRRQPGRLRFEPGPGAINSSV
jgi:hypothetical protein